MNQEIYASKAYVRSRNAYIVQCAFEYFVSILVADAFLAKVLTYIGISDSVIGIISSLISFSFLFQLLTIALMSYFGNTKRTVILFDTVSQFFFLGIYLVPFIPISVEIKTAIVIICLLLAYLLKYLISSIFFQWANSFVDPYNRGEFSAVKELVSLVSGIVFTLIVGRVIDHYESTGRIETGFIVIAVIMLVLNLCNFVSLLLIQDAQPGKITRHKMELGAVWKHTLQNRSFMNVVILSSLWSAAHFMTAGFMGTFKTSDLMMSVGFVQIINMAGSICRVLIVKRFGRYSDKTSYATGFRAALVILAVAYAVNMFTNPQRWWCVVVFTVLQCISSSGITQNKGNMCYNYVQSNFLVPALAIQNCISGLVGFAASLMGGFILSLVQNRGNQIFGLTIYGQQLLSGLSLLIVLAAVLFSKAVVEKQERVIQ